MKPAADTGFEKFSLPNNLTKYSLKVQRVASVKRQPFVFFV